MVAFHYSSYGAFCVHWKSSIISTGVLPTTEIIEPKKNVVILDAKQNEKTAKLTIKSNTGKGTIYLEVPCDISEYELQESIEKIIEAKSILDNNSNEGLNDLYIVEDKSGNLSIMTLTEYINYRKSIR